MATHLFHVKVIEVSDRRVVLKLRIITGEQPDFYTGKSFALMLLYDPVDNAMVSNAPLATEMSLDDTMNGDWLYQHLDDYIEGAKLEHVSNLPVAVDLEGMSPVQRRDFYKSGEAPSASLEIYVTDARWLAHLRKGMEWDSAAFNAQEV